MNNKILSAILTVINDMTITVTVKELEKQEYSSVFNQFQIEKVQDFNTNIASPLQKKVAEELLDQKNPDLDAVPLFKRLSFNRDTNTWRIDVFSIKISQFSEVVKQKTVTAFDNAFNACGLNINWAEMINTEE